MIILIWISALSGITLAAMVGARLAALKAGRIVVMEEPAVFFSLIQKKIDWLAVFLVLLFREGARWLVIKTLEGIKKLGSYLKIVGILIEKRFARVIDLVHGKGAISKKGAVSFFLREMGEHKGTKKHRSIS